MHDTHYIPSWQDKPTKFLFWTVDVLIVGLLAGAFAFLILKTMLDGVAIAIYVGFVAGVFAAYKYNKFKAGKHVGVVRHMLYWHVGTPSLKGLPPSHVRVLMG
jgi:type IV conjugative transfer system protein TraL